MTLRNLGRIDWGGGRERDLHRNYWVKFLVETDDPNDGPSVISDAPDLPSIGAAWTYGNENDSYALCQADYECETVIKREKNLWWVLKYTFTTRLIPLCAIVKITNPISQPDQISGSFVNYQELTHQDRDGGYILSSSLEPIFVNKDKHRATVNISQVGLNLQLPIFTQMINTLNDAPLWGLSTRCIKLRNVPWKAMYWNVCTKYYQRTLQFDIKFDTFDESKIPDMGSRVIDPTKPGYVADRCTSTGTGTGVETLDRTNPENFMRPLDDRGNVLQRVPLDGNGEMCLDPYVHQHFIDTVQLYGESNFLLLGIPTSL